MMKLTLCICIVGLSLCAFATAHVSELKEKIEEKKEAKEAAKEAKEAEKAHIDVGLFTYNCHCCNLPHCPCASQCIPKYWMRGTLTLEKPKCDCKKCCCKNVCHDHDGGECNLDCCKHCKCDLDCSACGCKKCKFGK
ncbi:Hypothetical protein NTJ_03026 [Nesidiocoris tenuis]|uniref:Uncharacterized protein n=1 Tax=Nesidiocoris tenuis TaxID=355587 RepID=A0ABN7ADZ2_9HEMI|nr:Hypothetical protein NTJ_03026 [Nesidiocoris tenuis]